MHIPSLSTDFIILLATLAVVIYGVVGGQASLIRETISVYVGMVLAATFGGMLFDYVKAAAGSSFPVTETAVKLVLLIFPVVILQFAHMKSHSKHPTSMAITLVLAVLSAMLLISCVLTQFSVNDLGSITTDSNLAAQIYNLKLVWVGLVPVAIAAAALFRPRPKH